MILRRLSLFIFLPVLLASLLVPFLNPSKAAAEGETYTWVNGLFRVSGGDLSGPSDLDFDRTEDDVVNIFAGTLQHNSGCTINMEIESNIATQETVTNVTGGSCSQSIRQSYDNLNISGNIEEPPDLTDEEIDVTIRIWAQSSSTDGSPIATDPLRYEIRRNGSTVISGDIRPTHTEEQIGDTTFTTTYFQAVPLILLPSQLEGSGLTYDFCPTNYQTDFPSCISFHVPANYDGDVIVLNSQPALEGVEGDPSRIGCPYSNPLNWVVCPFVTGAMSAISGIDIAINNLLNIGTEQIFDDDTETGKAYRTAWGIFRTFALAFIVIAALVMVISQAAGIDVLDAYTIRKVLPRLFIAAVGITLSWELMEASVILFNDLGQGVRDIIRAPFDDVFREAAQLSVGSTFIILLLTTGAIFAYGLLALLGFVVIILIAVLAAYAMLVLREIVIILLVILSPIFIALYVLPNTQRFSNIGFRAFFGLLLAYPMVMGTIAVGDVFSVVAASSEVGSITGASQILGISTFSVSHAALASGTLAVGELFGQGNAGQIAGVAAFIGTRAAIVPILARSYAMAGAVGGFIGGLGSRAAQGLSAPVSSWQRKRGAAVRGNRIERARTGNFFKRQDSGPRWWRGIKRGTNTGLSTAMNAGSAGFNPLKWRSRIREARERITEQQRDAMGKDEDWTWQHDDDLSRAAAESEGEGELRRILLDRYGGRYGWNGTTFTDPDGEKNLNRDLAKVRHMKEKYGDHAFRQAAHIKAVAGGAAYHSAADPYVAVARLAGDNAGLRANLVAATRSAAGAAGMQQQAAMSFGTALDVTTAIRNGMDAATASARLRTDVARSIDPHVAARGKLRSTTAIAHGHADIIADLLGNIGQMRDFQYFDADGRMHTETRAVEARDVKQAIGAAMGQLDALGGTGSVHGAAYADNLMSMGITREAAAALGIRLAEDIQGATLSQLFDMGLREDDHIHEIRREYATAASAAAAGRAVPPEAS